MFEKGGPSQIQTWSRNILGSIFYWLVFATEVNQLKSDPHGIYNPHKLRIKTYGTDWNVIQNYVAAVIIPVDGKTSQLSPMLSYRQLIDNS